jgi:lactate dehydrogenase-like 2-hydroxyacid dehydrogenase
VENADGSVPPVKILSTHRLPGPAWDELGDVEVGDVDTHRDDVEALIVANETVDDAVLDRLPALRLVACYAVGYDQVDVAACRARGIAVTNTPGVLDAATADLAVGLMLAARRGIVEGDALVRNGRWTTRWSKGPFVRRDVSGATLGVVGLGRIGTAVARRARAFDMRVVYHQRTPVDVADLEYRTLDDLLRESDVVSLHLPLNAGTAGLLSRDRLALLRDGATLVNTARGAIVDEQALVDELVSGRITAGLDVFVHEPSVSKALFDLPNVVLTPHIASATVETRAAMTRVVVDNVLAAERGEPLVTPV